MLPRHLRSLWPVHLYELRFGRASGEGEQARALSIESYDSIKYLYRDEIEFPLMKLRNLLYKEPSEIASGRVATDFADALRSYFDQLREIAREIETNKEGLKLPKFGTTSGQLREAEISLISA